MPTNTSPRNSPVLSFLRDVVERTAAGTALAEGVIEWVRCNADEFNIAIPEEFVRTADGDPVKDRHPLPFICTTNFVEHLDEAAARRFLFKARCGFLRPSQLTAIFLAFFKVDPPLGLEQLTRLTPADFALVRRKTRLLAADLDPILLLRLLREENAGKSRYVDTKGTVHSISNYGT